MHASALGVPIRLSEWFSYLRSGKEPKLTTVSKEERLSSAGAMLSARIWLSYCNGELAGSPDCSRSVVLFKWIATSLVPPDAFLDLLSIGIDSSVCKIRKEDSDFYRDIVDMLYQYSIARNRGDVLLPFLL